MYKRTYKFPGLALCVESEERISGNANFERFLTDEAEAHGHITVRRSPLPQVGEGKRNGRYRRMKRGGRGGFGGLGNLFGGGGGRPFGF